MYKGFFFDLDGVAYNGETVVETCRDFVNQLVDANIKVCFLTNNSSRPKRVVYEHLSRLGYHITEENIITSSEVTAAYIKEQENKNVFMIGMQGLYEELSQVGVTFVNEDADFVIVGLDLELTYEKLATANKEILKGASFISTNRDLKLSRSDGITPGNGSITKLLEYSSGVEPIYMGKPEPKMFEFGIKKLGLNQDEVVMVGDNYYTDIMGAHNYNIDSIFVETGVMTKEDLDMFDIKPTHVVKDLSYFKWK